VNKTTFLKEAGNQINHSVFVCELVENGTVISKNTFYFKPFKELKITKPEISWQQQKLVKVLTLR
jgi:beta-mannosidase